MTRAGTDASVASVASVRADADLPGGLPRRNGELVFEAPWESRAFGLAAAYVEASGCGWARFRSHLAAAIARLPDTTPYYEAWVTAVEDLLAADGVTPTG